MKPARYFVPSHLVDSLTDATQAHYRMAETVEALQFVNIIPFEHDDTVRVSISFILPYSFIPTTLGCLMRVLVDKKS